MIKQPLVSVVVPAWNAEATLCDTLQSVADQTYRHLEIIVVDDGSTDGTAAMTERFRSTDPRVRLIRQPNAGVASARNRAIDEAHGEWIAPIDADDLWHPTKIEKQIAAALSASERPGFVYCWHRFIDESGRVTGSGPRRAVSGWAFNQLAYCNPVENGSALLALRETVREVGGYDESLRAREAQGCEDAMLQLQIARAHPIALVPEHLVGHRRHGRNMSSDLDQIVRSWRLVYRQVEQEEPSLPSKVIRWVEGKCALDVAARRARSGHYLEAWFNLIRAMTLDPIRCTWTALDRASRSAVRRVKDPSSAAHLPHFYEADPSVRLRPEALGTGPFAVRLEKLNAKRLLRLAGVDASSRSPGR